MFTQAGGVERENPFMPRESVSFPSALVVWQDIRQAYTKFPTPESLRRVAVLRSVAADLGREGLVIDILIGGSLAVGQSTDDSDIDVFGVVTPERGLDFRGFLAEYETRFVKKLGNDVEFPVYRTLFCNTQDLAAYLDDNYFASLTNETWIRDMREASNRLYYQHYMNLGIGTARLSLIERMKNAKNNQPVFMEDSNAAISRSRFLDSYRLSFIKYIKRLSEHPDFSALPEPEKALFVEYLQERQHQFLFYLEYPQYCKWPNEAVNDQ